MRGYTRFGVLNGQFPSVVRELQARLEKRAKYVAVGLNHL
jgi:hypothetical protein